MQVKTTRARISESSHLISLDMALSRTTKAARSSCWPRLMHRIIKSCNFRLNINKDFDHCGRWNLIMRIISRFLFPIFKITCNRNCPLAKIKLNKSFLGKLCLLQAFEINSNISNIKTKILKQKFCEFSFQLIWMRREKTAKNKNATERNGFEDETRWEKLAGKNVQELWRRPRNIFPMKTR